MQRAVNTLILFMVTSGAVFLIFPEQHYLESGWGVLIKYIIYFPLVAVFILYQLLGGRIDKRILFVLTWVFICSLPLALGILDVRRFALYIMPAFAVLAPQGVYDATPKIAYTALWIAALGAIYEYVVLGGFPRFHPNGYRAISVFVNPNNLGITAVILYYFTFDLNKRQKIISFILSISIILASGSKTAILIFIILFAVRKIRITVTQALWGAVLSISAIFFVFQAGLIPLESIYMRFDQYENFFRSIDGVFFVTRSDEFFELYADNAFIQSWIEAGILVSLTYMLLIIYCAARDGFDRPLWLIFAAASMTTNVPFLFPLGYIFWFYVGQRRSPQLGSRHFRSSTVVPVNQTSSQKVPSV